MPTSKQKGVKVVRGWAVCFALNKRCMQDIRAFVKLADAKEYITELHKRIGGFEDDHHIVPCTISYQIKKK